MKKFMRIGAALFVAVAMLALIGCPTETETLETGAALLSVTIGGVSPTADDIPEGIPEAEWLSVGFDATSMETMLFRLDRTLFGTEGVYADAPVATSKSAGAKVYYGLSNAGLLPSEWVTTSTFNLRNQNVIYIAVESEDGFSRNYYRVRVYRENQSAAVNTLSIGGKVTGSHALLAENAHFPADNAFAPLADLSNKYPASRNVLYIKTFRLAGYLNFRRWWSV